MSLDKLTGALFHASIIAGCHRVIRHKQFLNEINVFPVADGDTGDNLSSTCTAIIEFSSAEIELKKTLETIADASIIGARGNSGIIFSQFFNLFLKHLPSKAALYFNDFSQILTQVSNEISTFLTHLIQGTMITLIQKWASLCELNQFNASFAKTMLELLPLLYLEVGKTKQSLKILKEANVVDAGALGFYYFIEGFTHFLQNLQNTDTVIIPSPLLTLKHPPQLCASNIYRYCTEAVLKSSSIDKDKLLFFLNEHGNCASVTGNERINRFHVHTNHPHEVFSGLYKDYIIQYPKVDDMLRQYQLLFKKKYSIGLVTDSSANLPQNLMDEYQIYQIPLNVHLGEHHFLDRYSFKLNDFYEMLNSFSHYPKTSCLAPKLIEEKFAQLSELYEHVIVLSVAKSMSGTFDVFQSAARHYDNITVIDTKSNSGGHGLILKYAGELISLKMKPQAVIERIKIAIENTIIYVVIKQFSSMIRSGRVSKIAGQVASWSKIKPIISLDNEGVGYMASKSFSFDSALKKMIKLVIKRLDTEAFTLADYCIVHAGEEINACQLAEHASDLFNKNPSFIEPVSLAIGLHVGKGCIALAARMEKRNEQ
ncbi:DegV family protein [Legionella israelensis]|uniref:Lipoprotein n=1 Tax=Legionella israelensis TaxID=454 RepID=A0A0W0VJD4_9GAMM|nr:DegV family protein [Legionella israelensis]KTD20228.1 lipoprotein [Legionella israelensis]QBS09014.1 DegV family EDD domain-containing protein [Legionella israelensis]SCY39782.1 hypothetical protein SAMN02746069_02301 [Legionella israelensis DSM 19235]STX58720.1 DAK2 domain protein [Legionella israelensis]